MTRTRRVVLLAISVLVAVAAFAVAGQVEGDVDGTTASAPRGDGAPVPPGASAPATAPSAGTTGETEQETEGGGTTAETEGGGSSAPAPAVPVIRVQGGQPRGGLRVIEVKRGGTARFDVVSDAPEEVHVRGYDIARDVGPGAVARFRFPATLEGAFEVELEGAHVRIVELRVVP
jgi:hypothetical protein